MWYSTSLFSCLSLLFSAFTSQANEYSAVNDHIPNKNMNAIINIIDKTVSADIAVNLQYGFNIPATCSKVQEKVKSAIETMTGLEVADVNIRIVGIQMNDK